MKGYTWLGEDDARLDLPLVVVEGPFDYLAVRQAYPNVVCALTSSFKTPSGSWFRAVRHWVTLFDTGKGGEIARSRLDRVTAKAPTRVTHLLPTAKDPGDMTTEEIRKLLGPEVDRTLSL